MCGAPPSFIASLGNGTTGNSDEEGATCCDPYNLSQAKGQCLTAGNVKPIGQTPSQLQEVIIARANKGGLCSGQGVGNPM